MSKFIVLVFLAILLVGCGSATTPEANDPPDGENAYYACITLLERKLGEPVEKAESYDPSMVETGESGIFWKVKVYYAYNKATYTCGIGYDTDTGNYALLALE